MRIMPQDSHCGNTQRGRGVPDSAGEGPVRMAAPHHQSSSLARRDDLTECTSTEDFDQLSVCETFWKLLDIPKGYSVYMCLSWCLQGDAEASWEDGCNGLAYKRMK